MRINTLKDFKVVVMKWNRTEGDGRPTLADIALIYAWNYVPDELIVDVLSYYKYENISGDVNDWKNKVLFNK
jgi:hypothetical protein